MSNQALTWARKSRGLTPTQKLVLLVLCDAANAQMQCWLASGTLAADTGLADRTVRAALHDLIEAGAIKGDMRPGVRPVWQIAVSDQPTTFEEKRQGVPVIPRKVGQSNRQPVPISNRQPVPIKSAIDSSKPATIADKPIEPNKKPKVILYDQSAFEAWWAHYPRKVGKDAARTAYAAAIKRGATDADLAAGLQRQQWPDDPQYVPHPRTWLAQGRWQDVPMRQAARPTGGRPSPLQWMADEMRGASPDPFTIDAEPSQ